jgi:hypothetical protein
MMEERIYDETATRIFRPHAVKDSAILKEKVKENGKYMIRKEIEKFKEEAVQRKL